MKTLGDLIRLLEQIDLDLQAEALADALWLAPFLDLSPDASATLQEEIAEDAETAQRHQPPRLQTPSDVDATSTRAPLLMQSTGEGAHMNGLPFRAPSVSAIPNQLEIRRSLRALNRRIPSNNIQQLDVAATVRHVADMLTQTNKQVSWQPQLRPVDTRWLDLDVVYDGWSSMVIWQRTIAELLVLLETQGAFRTVRTWSLVTNGSDGVGLRPGLRLGNVTSYLYSLRALASPHGRRLVLIVSDCVAPYWRNGILGAALLGLIPCPHVALLQMLPQRLWRRTGLGANVYHFGNPWTGSPNISNRHLAVRPISPQPTSRPPSGFRIPVVSLSPTDLQRWSRVLAGMERDWLPGVVLPASYIGSQVASVAPASAAGIVDEFWSTAFPDARRLAGYLAAAPLLNLPLIHMIQRRLMPDTDLSALAEVYLSGMLVQRGGGSDMQRVDNPDNLRFEFLPEVRSLLLSTVQRYEVLDVMEQVYTQVSAFVDRETGRVLDFAGVLATPERIVDVTQRGEGEAFASVAASILRALGGSYGSVAEHLERLAKGESSVGTKVAKEQTLVTLADQKQESTAPDMWVKRRYDIADPPVILLAFAREQIAPYQDFPRVFEEHKQLRALLEPAVRAGRCELLERPAVTLDDILSAFQDARYRGRIAVFHFAGHADSDQLLMESRPGLALNVGAAGLASFLATQNGLRLVFLNGSSTLAQAADLHAAGVGAVITTEDVGDDDALRFAAHFYRGLAGGASIAEAFAQAHGALQSASYAQGVAPDPSLWQLSARDEDAKGWQLPPPRPMPPPSRSGPIPLQKPLRVQHFTGREMELAKLLADLQPGKVATLCGPGGMGKSALAAEAIWALAPGNEPPERFPDGIIFHTFYHQPQASMALEKIARAYGLDPRPSPRDAALQALAGKTALLVLDGAEQADDLPAVLAVVGQCGVLITTRRHADAPDAVQDVEPLPRSESLALLRAWAGRYAAEDAAASDLVRLLGGLPLSLNLCGRYLAQRHQPAGEYVDWLKEEGLEALHFGERPSTSIPLLLRRSLEMVSKPAQAAFGVAGILALEPFDAATIAAALDIRLSAAHHALGELVDYGLLLRPDDSYQFTHGLAYSYARTGAPPKADVVRRLAMYYAATAEAESTKGLTGYAALAKQRAHIVAVQAATLKAQQWDAVRQITWKVEAYLDLQGYFTDRLYIIQAGLTAARASGARNDEAAFLSMLGNAYAVVGETRRAIEFHEQQLAIVHEIGDRRGEGNALGNLGSAYYSLSETRRAIEFHEQQLAIVHEIGDRRGEGDALGNLGLVYAALGETNRAVQLFEQQLAIVREIGDRRGEGSALGNLGLAVADLGDPRLVVDLFEQQLAIVHEIGDRRGEGNALGNLGAAHAALGDPRRAIEFYEQQLIIVREIGDRHGEGNALGNMGAAYYALGETRRAIELHEQRLVTVREIGDRRGEGAAINNLGLAYAALGEPLRAGEFDEQALLIAREIGDRRGEGNALGNLGLVYAALGETRRAVEYYEQQLVITREIGDRRGEGNALGNLGLVYAALGETRRAIEYHEQQLVITREIGDRQGEAIASWNLGEAYAAQGNFARAIALMQICVNYEQEISHPDADVDAQRVAELRAELARQS